MLQTRVLPGEERVTTLVAAVEMKTHNSSNSKHITGRRKEEEQRAQERCRGGVNTQQNYCCPVGGAEESMLREEIFECRETKQQENTCVHKGCKEK